MNCRSGPIVLRENYGFSLSRLRQIKELLVQHKNRICLEWERIHGAF